jgi:acetyltransferase-like isoleucine patch superfamily enzyme
MELDRFKAAGRNVKISRNAIVFGQENIVIGDNVRIDAGCILAAAGDGYMNIGSHVHLAPGSIFQSGGGIEIGDHAQIAAGCRLVSASDDLSGDHLVGPCAPLEARKVWRGRILIGRLATVGVGSIILPLCTLEEGSVLGANSMMKAHQIIPKWTINYGQPASFKKFRNRTIETLAKEFEYAYEAAKN